MRYGISVGGSASKDLSGTEILLGLYKQIKNKNNIQHKLAGITTIKADKQFRVKQSSKVNSIKDAKDRNNYTKCMECHDIMHGNSNLKCMR